MTSWYDNRATLAAFLRYLAEDELFTAEQIIRVVEKPHNWTREYEAWQSLLAAGVNTSPAAALRAELEANVRG